MKCHGEASCLGIILLIVHCVNKSLANENLPLQRYLPAEVTDEELMSPNKRYQQIMQDSWPGPQKSKEGKIKVKEEIDKLNITYVYQSSWPNTNIKFGQVTAVSFDKTGNVVIFHRVDRIWGQDTFDTNNVFRHRQKGAIRNSTVLAFDRQTGNLIYDWGKNLFYMPHGLTIDKLDNVWVTDVALHQVFKFGPRGSNDKPLMTLGTVFEPGAGSAKFCKPTSVAVLDNGDFFVADGYCNARIIKYSKNGQQILTWGQNSFSGISYEVAPKNFFAIPHALTLVPEQQLICAADRENGRVQCFYWTNGTFHSQYHSAIIGDRLFSMDYTPAEGGRLVIVNGPVAELSINPEHYNEVRGYILDMKTEKVISKFGPNDMTFENPHDVAVTTDGMEIYVAELNPMRIHKFLHKNVAKSLSLSVAKPTATIGFGPGPAYEMATAVNGSNTTTQEEHISLRNDTHKGPGTTAILVATLMLLFTFFTFAMAWLIARRRKRGCMPFGTRNRRHAWDFPAKPEGFKLGGLLRDRSKHCGFEKLENQNASDEETEATTNMLNNATPFA